MKTVITCGHPYSGFQLAYEVQIQAGLAHPQASRREAMSAEGLHDKIFKVHDLDRGGLDATTSLMPGRIWQDLSIDLFMGNIDQGDWGWADARSVWLLDFWKDLDSQTRFVLAYSSPEYAIGTALRDRLAGPEDVETLLASWIAYHSAMLRFYNRNPDRCLLVNVSTVTQEPQAFIEALSTSFNLKLNPAPAEKQQAMVSIPAIAATLARMLSENHDQANALYRELESAADIGDAGRRASDAEKRLALEEYLALLSLLDQKSTDAHECRERATRQEADLSKLSDELQSRATQLAQCQVDCDELKQRQSSLSEKHEKSQRQFEKVQSTSEKERLRLVQENELLLSQLHQVQEELEEYFLRSQEQSAELAAQQKKVETLVQTRDEQTKIATDRQAQIEKLTQARDEQTKIATDRQAQIEKLTQARDEQTKIASDRQAQIQKLTQARDEQTKIASDRQAQIQKLTQARDEQTKIASDRQAQIEKLTQVQLEHEGLKKQHAQLKVSQAALEARLKDVVSAESEKLSELNKENELLLIQLHQVQEELEHYFLQWQELSNKVAVSTEASTTSVIRPSEQHQPSEVVIDFRGEIDGENWYYAEHDGRWAGPGLLGTLRLPSLTGRRCEFFLDVVDAMEPEILAGMEVALNGITLVTTVEGAGYPAVVYSDFAIADSARRPTWEFRFSFPGTVSPAQLGSDDDDHRHLGIRVRSLKLRVSN